MITLEPPRNAVLTADVWAAWGLSCAGLSRFAMRAQEAVGLVGGVDVMLAGDSRLRKLNREFRGKDKATDVLSFPAAVEFGDGHAGDLAISLETARRQAAEHGHSLRDEVRVLMLHGMLHLAGFDHEADGGEMAAREAELRVKLRLPSGLIARVSAAAARKHTPGAKAPSLRLRGRAKAEALAYPAASATASARASATTSASAKATTRAKAGLIELRASRYEVRGKATAKALNAKGAKVGREGRKVIRVATRSGVAA